MKPIVAVLLLLLQVSLLVAANDDFVLFDDSLDSNFELRSTSNVNCYITGGDCYSGNSAIRITTPSSASPDHDTCGIFVKDHCPAVDLRKYTEIEFFIKSSPAIGFANIEMEDDSGNVDKLGAHIPQQWTRFRFPLPDSFEDVDFKSIIAPLLLGVQLHRGDVILVDNVVLRSRPFYDIFSDNTTFGREEFLSWGSCDCEITKDRKAPVGSRVIKSPIGNSGCGLYFYNPRIDISQFCNLEFFLKSTTQVKIELESLEGKHAVYVPSTWGKWKNIQIPLAQFNLGLHDIGGVFIFTKNSTGTEAEIDWIRLDGTAPPPPHHWARGIQEQEEIEEIEETEEIEEVEETEETEEIAEIEEVEETEETEEQEFFEEE